jgi:uncharacterized protein
MARSRLGIRIGKVPALAALAAAAVWLFAAHPVAADPPPPGTSVDCAHAQGLLETTICGDPKLVAYDRLTAQLFAAASTDALGVGPSAEAEEQRKWLAERDGQCATKGNEVDQCLRQEFEGRLDALAVAALIRAPEPALTELRQDPVHAPLYEAVLRMATMPPGEARTDAVAALIGPAFEQVRTAGKQTDDPDHGGGAITAKMLGPLRTARDAAGSVKNFDLFLDLSSIVDTIGSIYIPCEAIVRQPELIGAVGVSFADPRQHGLASPTATTSCPRRRNSPPSRRPPSTPARRAAPPPDATSRSPRTSASCSSCS